MTEWLHNNSIDQDRVRFEEYVKCHKKAVDSSSRDTKSRIKGQQETNEQNLW